MKVKEYLVLFALAALWGASFLFIRVAVAELSPVLRLWHPHPRTFRQLQFL